MNLQNSNIDPTVCQLIWGLSLKCRVLKVTRSSDKISFARALDFRSVVFRSSGLWGHGSPKSISGV